MKVKMWGAQGKWYKMKNCIAQALSAAVTCLQNDSWQFSISWLSLRGWSNVEMGARDKNCWLWFLQWPRTSCKVILIGRHAVRQRGRRKTKLCSGDKNSRSSEETLLHQTAISPWHVPTWTKKGEFAHEALRCKWYWGWEVRGVVTKTELVKESHNYHSLWINP